MSTVTELLEERKLPFRVIAHHPSFTSIEEAITVGIPSDLVVKTVVLDTEAGHVLAVIPASRRLDLRQVRRCLGNRRVRLADEAELARDFPDYELGALPPVSSLLHAPLLVDEEVVTHESVVIPSGTGAESVLIRTEDLFRGEAPNVGRFTRHPEEEDDDGAFC